MMAMYREKRFEEIKRLLAERQELSIEDIMQAVNVSRDTARRDIVALAERGVGRRTRGGLIAPSFGQSVPSYSERLQLFSEQKSQMAQLALGMIHPGGVYFIDDSTTLLKLSQSIAADVTIYTHSLDNAIALSVQSAVTLRMLGGTLNQHARFFFEPATLHNLARIAFDAAFIGATAIDASGVNFGYEEDALVKSAAASAARQVVVVSETQKLQLEAPYRGLALDQIDTFITDRPLNAKERRWFDDRTTIITPDNH